MENKQIKALVKKLAKVVYPNYNGRKFSAEVKARYFPSDFWDDGSRNYMVAIDLKTGRIVEPSDNAKNPYNIIAHTGFDIPAGVGILEHSFFCGKDLGIRLYVSSPLAIEAVKQSALEGWQKAIEAL
jgi:hypothetical protein